MTEPQLSVMLERYRIYREKERKYREIAERYEIAIIEILVSRCKEAEA